MNGGRNLPAVCRKHLPESVLLLLCWIPYYLLPRELPAADWQSGIDTVKLPQEVLLISMGENPFSYPVPYLRNLLPSLVVGPLNLAVDLDLSTTIWIIAQYTILLEGVATPLALYYFAVTVFSKRVGWFVLLFTALFQFSIVPWHPQTLFQTISHSPNPFELLWGTFYAGSHWQYAHTLAPILFAFAFATKQKRTASPHAPIVSGVFLGIAGSIQVIQGSYAAAIISISLIWQCAWRDLIKIAGISTLVALPNILVIIQPSHYQMWIRRGIERLNLFNVPVGGVVELVALFTLIVALAVAAVLVLPYLIQTRGPPWLQRYHNKTEWIAVAWPVSMLIVFTVTSFLAANWYRYLAAGLFKYAFFLWAGALSAHLLDDTEIRHVLKTRLKLN